MQMTTKIAENIIDNLQCYIKSAAFSAFERDNPTVSEQIKNLKASDLRIGDCPVLGIAQLDIDVTADGVSYTDARGKKTNIISSRLDDGYIQRYKLACTYSSDPMLFASPENKALPAVCAIAAERVGFSDYHYESEAKYIAENIGKKAATAELKRLDYKMENCRVNSYNINYTYGPLPVPIYPIIADLKDKKGKSYPTVIGTYCEDDLDSGEKLSEPEINVNVMEILKKQKLGSKTSKAAKKKKIIKAVLWTVGALAVVGVFAYFLISCIL